METLLSYNAAQYRRGRNFALLFGTPVDEAEHKACFIEPVLSLKQADA
jgi:hypothetical protein